jgi:hypothetical protein
MPRGARAGLWRGLSGLEIQLFRYLVAEERSSLQWSRSLRCNRKGASFVALGMNVTRWLVLSLFVSASALAQEPKKPRLNCTLQQGKDDLVVVGKDAVIEPGQRATNVLVIDGNVTVKRGARVKTVFVSNGDATIERGATVDGSVLVVGGKAKVARKQDVRKGIITVDDGLHIVGDDGKGLDLNLSFDGESLGHRIVSEVAKEMRGCAVMLDE